MIRRVVTVTILILTFASTAVLMSTGCNSSDTEWGTPLYIHPGDNPYETPDRYVVGIYVQPPGVNIAVGGLQQFTAIATFNDGLQENITKYVEWFAESPAVGVFETTGGRFLAKNPGVALVRCRLRQGEHILDSQASYVNSFNPNADIPPAVPMNPLLGTTDEGVVISWDLNKTDGDLAGYNVWRTQVSAAHYATDYGKLNDTPILYPPYLDKTVVSGWYYYRVTAEDLIGLNSAPSEQVAVFVTNSGHYGSGYDAGPNVTEENNYKDAFSTAF